MRRIEGIHLIVDGYVVEPKQLERGTVFGLFDTLVEALGMQYLTRPVATDVDLQPELLESEEDEGGTSYWAQITTSHLALHAWPLRGAFMFDVFSCKPFDPNLALEVILKTLNVRSYAHQVVQRIDPGDTQRARAAITSI